MKDILDKLTSYNLFNYLLPGVVFAFLANQLTRFSFIQSDLVIGAFVYYFIGLVISRVGSLIIEPLLKRLSFLTFSEYEDFVKAAKVDGRIEVLSEANNSYRTLASCLLLVLLLKVYDRLITAFPGLAYGNSTLLLLLLAVMFLLAYRKQTAFITRRVNANSGRTEDTKGKAATV